MISLLSALVLFSLGLANAASLQTCPLLGQQYPPPKQISTEPEFLSSTRIVEAYMNANLNEYPINESTFSIGMWSTFEDGLSYQYHHTSDAVANGKYGAKKVDADSIYRIGSISKLLTMYLFLICDGDRHFNDPVSEHIPGLLTAGTGGNAVTPLWDEITIGDLAGQMGGLARDFGLADLAIPGNGLIQLPQALQAAFPQLPTDQIPTCGYLAKNGSFVVCSQDEYLAGLASESPIFATAYSPAYSNEAFALLGLALSNIEGQALEDVFNERLVKALDLAGTYFSVPDEITEHDVIPGEPTASGWDSIFGVFASAGGFYSSLNDFAIMGKAMLNSALISKSQTNRWFKPASFVEAWDQGVGRPWEIFRVKVNGQSVDLYAKGGDWGQYHTWHCLVPTYDFGFTVLTASDIGTASSSDFLIDIPNHIVNAVLPALDDIAKKQANDNFAGQYLSSGSNSSITISTDDSSALRVSEWISNGADLLGAFEQDLQPNLDFRILPNQLNTGNQIGFTSFYQSAMPPPKNGTFFWNCPGWVDVDELTFGNIPLGQMVFNVDENGMAISVEARAFRTTLQRQ